MASVQINGDTSGSITLAAPAVAGSTTITFPATTGTSVVNPLPSASLITASAGLLEYDGKVPYITPQGTQRGVIPGAQFFRLNADLAGANSTAAQSIFGVGVTLSSSTVYEFEFLTVFSKTAGTTAHTFSLGFGGTATINNILYGGIYNGSTTVSGTSSGALDYYSNTANATQSAPSISAATTLNRYNLRGAVSINAGGTFIPQYTLSAAPGGAYSTVAGSYFMIYPIGASGSNTSVGTWA